jgi:hypothetical protein
LPSAPAHGATGRTDASMARMLELVADHLRTPEIIRYEAAIRGNAKYLAGGFT